MSATATTTTITNGHLCDLSVVSVPTLRQSMADPDYPTRLETFAVDRTHHLHSEAPTLIFPVDVSLGAAFDRVDLTLRIKYIDSVVSLAQNPECAWNDEQMRETAFSALGGVGIPAKEHDHRLGRYTKEKLEELTKETVPRMGQLVMVQGRPGIIQTWQSYCCRQTCAFSSRPFKAGQTPVPLKRGWAHAKICDDTRPPEPITAIPSSCGTCKRPFEDQEMFVTSIMATDPQHLIFDDKGKSSRCSASVLEPGLVLGSLEDAASEVGSVVREVDASDTTEDSEWHLGRVTFGA